MTPYEKFLLELCKLLDLDPESVHSLDFHFDPTKATITIQKIGSPNETWALRDLLKTYASQLDVVEVQDTKERPASERLGMW